MPTVTVEQAREALLGHVAENCCYGKKAAQEMVFNDVKHSSAFHVSRKPMHRGAMHGGPKVRRLLQNEQVAGSM